MTTYQPDPIVSMDPDIQELVDFLLDRIAEDERAAPSIMLWRFDPQTGQPGYQNIGPKVLAEARAKREVIRSLVESMDGEYAPWNEDALKLMAAPYAHLRGFDPAWLEVSP